MGDGDQTATTKPSHGRPRRQHFHRLQTSAVHQILKTRTTTGHVLLSFVRPLESHLAPSHTVIAPSITMTASSLPLEQPSIGLTWSAQWRDLEGHTFPRDAINAACAACHGPFSEAERPLLCLSLDLRTGGHELVFACIVSIHT